MNRLLTQSTYLIFCIGIFFISILTQTFVVPRLPDKYFYDSVGILSITNSNFMSYFDHSYLFTGNFFKSINIFGFTTFNEWAISITLIFSIFTSIFLMKYQKIRLHQALFILITILFNNIYIFRISKDFVQLLFWILIYLIGKSDLKEWHKNIFIFIIFIFEGINFRSYYMIIGILYILLNYFFKTQKKINYKKLVFLLCFGIFIGLNILNIIAPSTYNQVVNMRYNQNFLRLDSGDAVTAINDLLPQTSVLNYMINYLLNLFRILFPIELIFKGIKYVPFIIYQFYFTIMLLLKTKSDWEIRFNNIYLPIIIAYLLVANLFEPDFGSVIRHEAALYFIFLEVFLFRNDNKKEY